MPTPHIWTFFRAGGLDQVLFETADDFRNLAQLDQKLWVALTCPVKGLQFDARTLELIDADHDGRVIADGERVVPIVGDQHGRHAQPIEHGA